MYRLRKYNLVVICFFGVANLKHFDDSPHVFLIDAHIFLSKVIL
jgi:hypothetical protein